VNYQDVIEITSGKRSGKPFIKNTRITVWDGWQTVWVRMKLLRIIPN